jgi:hypothetical protein
MCLLESRTFETLNIISDFPFVLLSSISLALKIDIPFHNILNLTFWMIQIHFPKRCFFEIYRIPDDEQSSQTMRFWELYTIIRTV